jgi:anti-sigma B factor antagonist
LADPALLHVEVRKADQAVILDLQGKLAAGFGDQLLRETLDELFAEGWKAVLVNLTRVSFIDSAGLGELVAGLRRAQREGVSLKLLNNKAGRVHETLYVSRILPLFEVFESEDKALAAF